MGQGKGRHGLRPRSDEDYLQRTRLDSGGSLWPANSRHLRCICVASPSSRIQHLNTAYCSQQPPSLARPRSAAFEKKKLPLLLTRFPHRAGFLRQKERYPLTKTWWTTTYVVRWNIGDDAIRSSGTCSSLEKIYRIFLHFSYTGVSSIFTGFFSILHGENPV